ncbi:MAG: 1,4-dihydroxy-2-naphthoate polyprenyltransferase [Cyclobacteriaceae bacterium]
MEQTINTKKKAWLHAFRFRTLPLALSSIFMGSILAYQNGNFHWSVFLWAALTTVLLQILSNLANDYGDSVNGADHQGRNGPVRAVQSGLISLLEMKKAMILFGVLSLISGLILLYVAIPDRLTFLLFLGLGILAIFAAVTYTYGGKPYGYAGLGDLSVFIFFGLAGVLGTYYLHTLTMDWVVLLPGAAIGFFSTAVLNINNIRDIDSDRSAGKMSIPVRIGKNAAIIYQWSLILGGIILLFFYILIVQAYGSLLFLLAVPVMLNTGWAIQTLNEPELIDPYLKKMAMATLLCVLGFGLGWMIF